MGPLSVLPFTPDYAREEFEMKFCLMLDRGGAPLVTHTRSHGRWHWALAPEPLTVDCFFEEPLGIGICGDWCAGSRVEGAFRSGLSLADQIIANV